ncbi:hypothetical protein VIGAN_08334400 [Vigna angularis var. angularis]|uniref:Uncharacterized protein n=1 Tax=Vigna angularis var. angularis TaxID=157739 RepID=A0A0S3SUA4_PHAAN|nr:hypothetical protein VIGAN_08334400 [Vigna angularis var. angularis]
MRKPATTTSPSATSSMAAAITTTLPSSTRRYGTHLHHPRQPQTYKPQEPEIHRGTHLHHLHYSIASPLQSFGSLLLPHYSTSSCLPTHNATKDST